MRNSIFNNLGLKMLALALAFITWFFVVMELQKGNVKEREVMQSIFPYKMESRNLPIKIRLTGEAKRGFVVLDNKIITKPESCVIVGPRSLLEKLTVLETEPIDISNYTRTFTRDVSIASPDKNISVKEKFVTVTVPIAKVD